jgi:hypothetical protein
MGFRYPGVENARSLLPLPLRAGFTFNPVFVSETTGCGWSEFAVSTFLQRHTVSLTIAIVVAKVRTVAVVVVAAPWTGTGFIFEHNAPVRALKVV